MNFRMFLLSVTLMTFVGKTLSEEEGKPTDDIEVNNRQLFNLGINLGSWGSQGLYTSLPQNQRRVIEGACRYLMAHLASVSATPRTVDEDSEREAIVPSKRILSIFGR